MTVPVALDNAIEIVRKRIQQMRERKDGIGEQNTKAAFIEPILIALGWDLQEIDEVRREYRCKPQDNPVDYALFLQRSECLFIEAKSFEKDLNDRKWISQNLSYATVVGVKWCVLTNGDEYRIYNSHAAVDVEQKLFRSVRISDTANAAVVRETLNLLSKAQMQGRLIDELWKLHFVDRNVGRIAESLFASQDGSLVKLICRKAKGLTPSEVKKALKRARVQIDFPAANRPLPAASAIGTAENAKASKHEVATATLADLIQSGAIRVPMRVEREYKGRHLTAIVREDGKVEFAGRAYHSLSTAAAVARKSVIGGANGRPYPQTNGWTFWKCATEDGGELRLVDDLRRAPRSAVARLP